MAAVVYSFHVRIVTRWCPVQSLDDAARVVRAEIEATGMGSREWYSAHVGIGAVRDAAGKEVARIAYNGRAFGPGGLGDPPSYLLPFGGAGDETAHYRAGGA